MSNCHPRHISSVKSTLLVGKFVLKCLLSPDVRQLVTASADKTIKLWNVDGFKLERTLSGIVHFQVGSQGFVAWLGGPQEVPERPKLGSKASIS